MINRLTDALPSMPKSMVAGDSLRVAPAGLAAAYPSTAGYSVTLIMVPERGGDPVSVAAEWAPGAWSLALAGDASADLAPGAWRWAVRVEGAGGRFTADNGVISVLPDPTSNADRRSHARRVLDSLEAAIEGRASATDLENTLADGRQIKRMSHEELLKMRDAYAAKVAVEDRRAGRGGPSRILVSL